MFYLVDAVFTTIISVVAIILLSEQLKDNEKINQIYFSANQNAAIIVDPTSTAAQMASAQVLFDSLVIDLKGQSVIVLRNFISSF